MMQAGTAAIQPTARTTPGTTSNTSPKIVPNVERIVIAISGKAELRAVMREFASVSRRPLKPAIVTKTKAACAILKQANAISPSIAPIPIR